MNILGIVRRECVAAGRSPTDKRAVLAEIAGLAKANPALDGLTREEIESGLLEREEIGTTGFGKGIAIPHCRLSNVPEFVVGVMTVPGGVEFDSLDGQKVRLLVFIIGPATESSDHIRILSTVSRVLSSSDAVAEMIAADSDEALYESFARHLRDDPRAGKGEPRSLFQVFVQGEELFREILEVFGATEPRFTAVLEAENASSYLAKVPLFAGLWSDNPRTFSRVIVSLVSKRMTNELVRRIESVTGPLSKCDRVLVMVQDVFFSGGSLTT
jgi:mannitol/fructose-specific phosphotransferase system IIA component (Ntr-type)